MDTPTNRTGSSRTSTEGEKMRNRGKTHLSGLTSWMVGKRVKPQAERKTSPQAVTQKREDGSVKIDGIFQGKNCTGSMEERTEGF